LSQRRHVGFRTAKRATRDWTLPLVWSWTGDESEFESLMRDRGMTTMAHLGVFVMEAPLARRSSLLLLAEPAFSTQCRIQGVDLYKGWLQMRKPCSPRNHVQIIHGVGFKAVSEHPNKSSPAAAASCSTVTLHSAALSLSCTALWEPCAQAGLQRRYVSSGKPGFKSGDHE